MTKDEALKLALKALKTLHDENMDYLTRNKLGGENNQCMVFAREAITAIKKVLAQPEQEPVLWGMPDGKTVDKWALQFYGGQKGKPLYTTPPQRTWVGLTEGERIDIIDEEITTQDITHYALAQAIEATLKEKNT
jgi:hypothetical protein